MKGWVYIMTNKAMPDIVNVSYTMKDPSYRPMEMSYSESPYPYVIKYKLLVEDPPEFEKILKARLAKQEEGNNWFRCSIEEAVAEIGIVENILEDSKLQKSLEEKKMRSDSAALSFIDYLGYFFGVAIIIFLGFGSALDRYIESTFLGVVILLFASMICSLVIFMIIIPLFKGGKQKSGTAPFDRKTSVRHARSQSSQNDTDISIEPPQHKKSDEPEKEQKEGELQKQTEGEIEGEVPQKQTESKIEGEISGKQIEAEVAEKQKSQVPQEQKGDDNSQKQKADKTPQKQNGVEVVLKQSQKEDPLNKKSSPPGTPLSNFYSTTYLNCYLKEHKTNGILALYTDASGNFFAYHSDLEMRPISEKLFDQLKNRYGMKYESGEWI
ncbi:MAG: GIY-YIG nuclease family protein [Desulfamplus sp.]|nr:GIY-YIG nuclease family protein [Desulfamplus sp.]